MRESRLLGFRLVRSLSNKTAIHIPQRETNVLYVSKPGLLHPATRFGNRMVLTVLRRHALRQIQQRRPPGRRPFVVQELCLNDQPTTWCQKVVTSSHER